MLTTLSPWLCLPFAVVFLVVGVFLLLLVYPMWRRDDWQPDGHVLPCRVASVFCAFAGAVLVLLAIASAHAALYGWGVL